MTLVLAKIINKFFSVGADGKSEFGLKFDSLGLDPTSSLTASESQNSFTDKFDEGDSPESSLNRQVSQEQTLLIIF
jgi:hypothetical protein